MLFDDSNRININLLRNHFYREGKLTIDCAFEIIKRSKAILSSEPNLLYIQEPVIICGDIHGQFYDLLNIFEITKPTTNNKYIFLGDYVDRGDFSCEVLFYLLSYKINFPNQFYLLRGNHESRMMTENMTFFIEVDYKYKSIELFNEINSLFDCLPLAAVIHGSSLGNFFCTHGGISEKLPNLFQYNDINRFQEPPSKGAMCDILWADPLEEPQHPETMEKVRLDAWLAINFTANHLRQTSFMFGPRSLLTFLKNNNLVCVIRAHQVMDEGFKLHYFIQDRDIPPCITVFSAPNYCDMYQNKGSILKINNKEIKFEQFEYIEHPFNFPDFFDCFSFSLPTLIEIIVNILSELVVAVKEEGELNEEEKKNDLNLQNKLKLFKLKNEEKIKEKQNLLKLKKEIRNSQLKNKILFDNILNIDKINEQKPK